MLVGRTGQPGCCRLSRPAQRLVSVQNVLQRSTPSRQMLTVVAGFDFNKMFGKGKGDGNKQDAAKKALQDSFNQKKFQNFFGDQKQQQPQQQAGGGSGFGSFGGAGGGGGGGGGGGDGAAFGGSGGEGGSEKPIMTELLELFKGLTTVFWNLALFLAFADVLHRSLDWCCQVELLLLVGAPQQAFERLSGKFFDMVEWFEKNVLGWDIPGDDDMIPMYENIKTFYPEEHAYVFDQYKYNMTDEERKKLLHTHALPHYMREGGKAGDVDPVDLKAIQQKYQPMEADRLEYQRAKRAGRLEDYWASKRDTYEKVVGSRFVRPGTGAEATA